MDNKDVSSDLVDATGRMADGMKEAEKNFSL